MQLDPGTILDDRFEIVAYLGAGRTTFVHKARHCVTDELVAVRVVSPWIVMQSLAADARYIDQFSDEIAHRQIQNEHVIEIVEVIYRNQELFLVTELVDTPPLAITPRPWPEVADIVLQMCDAAAVHHARGVFNIGLAPEKIYGTSLHKLDNFFVDRLPIAHIGLMEMRPRLRYSSPEHMFGRPLDAGADVYALGVLAYELATGRHPFDCTNLETLARALIDGAEPAPTNLPPQIDAVIRKCLRPEREQRYDDVAALRAALSPSCSY